MSPAMRDFFIFIISGQEMKTNLLFIAAFLSVIIYANIDELHGIVGMTRLDGSVGCVCHGIDFNDSVFVWIDGPDSIFVNDTAYFKILMTGGPAISGGFNVAARIGHLDSLDFETRIIIGQLTHSAPKSFLNDTVYWSFKYTAPDSIVTDTIYSVANSVNGDSIPSSLDKWNFGENFAVFVIDNPTTVKQDLISVDELIFHQNYPNPFNPVTSIEFQITNFGNVTLKVYDLLGSEVATIINEEKQPGVYKFKFDASGLPSGIYFYKLEVGNFIDVKKMLLLK